MNILRFGLRGLVATGVIVLLVGILGAGAATSGTSPLTNPKHFFWAQGSGAAAQRRPRTRSQNDLIYHGGNAGAGAIGVEPKPAVYLICWGPDWTSGFTTADTNGAMYSSKTLPDLRAVVLHQRRRQQVGGVQTQYCADVAARLDELRRRSPGQFVTNPKGQLKGVWTDPTPVPRDIVTLGLAENLVDDPIASEAQRAAAHFGYNPQATYIILTPPTTIGTGEPVLLRLPHADHERRRPRQHRSGSSTRSSRA